MIHSEKSGISKLIKSDGESSEKSLNFYEWTEQYFYYKKITIVKRIYQVFMQSAAC